MGKYMSKNPFSLLYLVSVERLMVLGSAVAKLMVLPSMEVKFIVLDSPVQVGLRFTLFSEILGKIYSYSKGLISLGIQNVT